MFGMIKTKIFIKKKSKKFKLYSKKVDFIILSPGVSLKKTSNKKKLSKFENKIITDIDLLYLSKKSLKVLLLLELTENLLHAKF